MERVQMIATLLVLLAVASGTAARPTKQFANFPSWNTKTYPVWKANDPRYKDTWKGGKVTFNVGNDSPSLTGAKVTFTIDLVFPHTQKVQPDGAVVWAEDCIVNGTKYYKSEPVFPTKDTEWECAFPDGTPIKTDKQPDYVFVWKTWEHYWQVADGPSSSLTIGTDDIPLGSYTMDIVIYHYRSKERFIPLGYASTQFSITDQIPFSVSLGQVNDIVADDLRFIQNRAITFTTVLHDPSDYLSNADITFNWDFGDDSGALIAREPTVTHTYVNPGSFKPKVVVQAVIPDKACDPPVQPNATTPVPPANQSSKDAKREVRLTGQATVGDSSTDNGCSIYRYGSFCTNIEVDEGIAKVEIIQMDNTVVNKHEADRDALDLTVTCQGSFPKEVCSVIMDAECLRPIHTVCNMVEPSKVCQMVLRHIFNDSGIYCINVSMADDTSFAVTSTKVAIRMGSRLSPSSTAAMVLGILILALLLGIVAHTYRSRRLPAEDVGSAGDRLKPPQACSRAAALWQLLKWQGAVDSCPLLQEKPV